MSWVSHSNGKWKENVPYTTLERICYSIAKEKEVEQLDELEYELRDEELISLDEVVVRKGTDTKLFLWMPRHAGY